MPSKPKANWTRLQSSTSRALALKPNLAEVHVNLGNIFQAQGELNDSAECYERALVLKPDTAETYNNLGNTRQAQGKLDDALACYERALPSSRTTRRPTIT